MGKDVFRKQVEDTGEIWSKCLSLYNAGLSTGGFYAPKPLRYSERDGWIELEKLQNLVPLSSVLVCLDKVAKKHCLQLIGQVLGGLHKCWAKETGVPVNNLHSGKNDLLAGLPGLVACEKVMVHGDFGFGNIFCLAGNWKRLVILDPEPAPFLTLPVNAVMSPALDLCHFSGCLEGVFPPRHYLRYPWSRTSQFRREFLAGYCKTTGVYLPMSEIDILTGRLLRVFGDWLQEPGHSLSNWFLGWFLNHRARIILEKGN